MRLKEMRGERKQKDVVQYIQKSDPRVDVSLYSKYENGVALPTPPQLKAVCDFLGVDVSDIYADEEINLKSCKPTIRSAAVKSSDEPDTYNLCVRLERDVCKWLKSGVLKACGYRNIKHFVGVCLVRLRKEYEKAQKAEKKRAARLERQGKAARD